MQVMYPSVKMLAHVFLITYENSSLEKKPRSRTEALKVWPMLLTA